MQYHPVVDRFAQPHALDPIWLMLFVAAFIGIALLTERRPIFGLLALIATTPFLFAHSIVHSSVTLPKVALLAVALGLLAHRSAWARLRERSARIWLLAFLGVVAATLLSVTQANYLVPAVRETLKAVEALAIFAVAVTACVERADLERYALPCFTAVAALVSVLALLDDVIGAPSGLRVGALLLPRIAGPLGGPNQLAAFLEIALAILVAAQLAQPRRWLACALFPVALAEALTLSRAGIGASVLIVAVLLVLQPQRARAILVPLGSALGIAVALATIVSLRAESLGLLRLDSPSTGVGGVGTRPQLWHAALLLWLRHPWLGIGAGNYQFELGRVGLLRVRTQANSLYLQSLVEGGMPLLAATLWLWVGGVARLARMQLHANPWAAAAFAATLGLGLHGIVDDVQFYPKVLTWWILLVAIATSSDGAAKGSFS